ncbi:MULTISPECIES: Bug family tripartite tricarboxylate transporter substrate binding protein [Ramlibacter]|nr:MULTISPECIES: tripartite tricarboxylate transporter substrate binding protein [Ramlibacter]MBA2962616.1 tripartite tricarboxylate transporter substrate binding protein [Ramlibacter sp. CGMCC 1.13660]
MSNAPRYPQLSRRTALSRILAGSVLGSGMLASPARAQDFPNKPVKVILMYPPGGGADNQARVIGEQFRAATGQAMVIESRPGGGGGVAANAAKGAQPDGYTLLNGNLGMMTLTPALNTGINYSVADFVPVAAISIIYPLLVARADFPASNLKELAALAKAKPREISYGTWGLGSVPHVAGAWLEEDAGIQLSAIPYRGEVPMVVDLLGGQLPLGWASLPAVQQHVKDGKLKVIGVAAETRFTQLPDTPTFIEQGLRGFAIPSWFGYFAPKGTPPAIVAALNAKINEALNTPHVRSRIEEQGQVVLVQSSSQFNDFIQQNAVRIQPTLTRLAATIRQ